MLKALELIGFKSFAEKTRFEFPRGISVVVGPNGSGKSNIVNAIKWVLGEQSVKSLRGKEMADVIFNGSASRRPLNSAETTLTFDNSARRLPIDTPDVQITRRVYRSGEGEYLINRQPCRLRDIRDLFAGTGMATEAYSVIEQGKVDVLLQASPRDRRVIFEEAAGISRFKVKKLEALRRLERVEQNLLRLSDIVDEVDSRLKSARLQAGKARRYKEHADRLQELRTQVASADWRALGARLAECEDQAAALRREIEAETSAAEAGEARVAGLETRIALIDEQIRTSEARLAAHRERIAAIQSAIDHEQAHGRELDEQAARLRRQLASLSFRAGNLEGQLAATRAALAESELQHRAQSGRLADEERALTALNAQLDQVRNENEQRRAAFLEQSRAAAVLASDIRTGEVRVAQAEEHGEKSRLRLTELEQARRAATAELAEQETRDRQLAAALEACTIELIAARGRLEETRRRSAASQRELAQWRERLSAAGERAAVLAELDFREEGVGAGVKDLLRRAREQPDGPLRGIVGMLANLLKVGIETAPLIDIVLGERAQHLVVSNRREWHDLMASGQCKLQGRVGLLSLSDSSPHDSAPDLAGRPGVVGRALGFVESPPELRPLVRRILGHTWIVEDLARALELAAEFPGRSDFITRAGELLTADGTLVAGPRSAALGLISRRSERRALAAQITQLEQKSDAAAAAVAALERALAEQDAIVLDLAERQRQAGDERAGHTLALGGAVERAARLGEQYVRAEADCRTAESDCRASADALAAARTRLEQVQIQLARAEARLSENNRRLEQLDDGRQQRFRASTSAKVELARGEQQLDHLRARLRQSEQDRQERDRSLADAEEQLAACLARAGSCEAGLLTAESELAELYLRKETFGLGTTALVEQREALRGERAAAAHQAARQRGRIRKLEERLHQKDLQVGEVRHERSTLEDRLREDYAIDLASLAGELSADDQRQRSQVEEEIAELRRKLTNIGGVNLDSLQEADELETRFQSLSSQFDDLSRAKAALEQIIGRINADSRRLFAETLDTVKEHFQSLFRKLFGGGRADIVLEEGVDILDSGIEIVARPPGKEPRSISLLSGGEKTLTCVALLLAIFRSRPSPFCVLDEVDAALDEANIDRFIAVLTEFLAWTQFIVVTHSKKTMTCADTLYGVTMQESGVSKRVSVRFEDVSENGQINPDALATAPPPAAGDDSEAA